MIVAISGTRDELTSAHRTIILRTVESIRESFLVTQWRVGDCPTGVDAHVRDHLSLPGLMPPYVAPWGEYGKAAGPIRNREMLSRPRPADLLLAFPSKGSRGTMDCVEAALDWNLDVVVTWLL